MEQWNRTRSKISPKQFSLSLLSNNVQIIQTVIKIEILPNKLSETATALHVDYTHVITRVIH